MYFIYINVFTLTKETLIHEKRGLGAPSWHASLVGIIYSPYVTESEMKNICSK